MSVEDEEDNPEILKLLIERMELGKKRYGHGIRANDDTRQFGTKDDSWTEMGLEEVLDLTLYLAAQIIRILKAENEQNE